MIDHLLRAFAVHHTHCHTYTPGTDSCFQIIRLTVVKQPCGLSRVRDDTVEQSTHDSSKSQCGLKAQAPGFGGTPKGGQNDVFSHVLLHFTTSSGMHSLCSDTLC